MNPSGFLVLIVVAIIDGQKLVLIIGMLPRKHGMIGDYVLNWRTGRTFLNFTVETDFEQSEWWTIDPLYVTATRAKASVAMFFFPECKIDWSPSPHFCVPPRDDGLSFADEHVAETVSEATKVHDLVLVYHPNIREQIAAIGPQKAIAGAASEVEKFQQALERLTAQARERIDLNVMVVSAHGLVDVPKRNIRILDDYLPMELLQTSVGSPTVRQLIAMPGKTHQVYSQLRNHTPIPNVQVYYTTPKVGDLPERYNYKKSSTTPDLVLVAQPEYAITTRDPTKSVPVQPPNEVNKGMSGYDNHHPDMLGIFLAYGPVFRKGYHKGPLELCDIYTLICAILRLEDCHSSCGRILRIDDVLTSDARVVVRSQLHRSNQVSFPKPSLVIVVVISVAFL